MADPGSIRAREPSFQEILELLMREREAQMRASSSAILGGQGMQLVPLEEALRQLPKAAELGARYLWGQTGQPLLETLGKQPSQLGAGDVFNLTDLIPQGKGAAFFLPGHPKPRRFVGGTDEDMLLEGTLRRRSQEPIENPRAMAEAIAEARAARDSATGSPAVGLQEVVGGPVRMGSVREPRLQLELQKLGRAGKAAGIPRAAEDRIVEDVLLDDLVEQLSQGRMAIAPTTRGEIQRALPRERHLPEGQMAYAQQEAARVQMAQAEAPRPPDRLGIGQWIEGQPGQVDMPPPVTTLRSVGIPRRLRQDLTSGQLNQLNGPGIELYLAHQRGDIDIDTYSREALRLGFSGRGLTNRAEAWIRHVRSQGRRSPRAVREERD